jgi:hypothetical protein
MTTADKKAIEENKKAIDALAANLSRVEGNITTMDGKITSMEASMVTMGTNIAKMLEEMQRMSTNSTIGANSTNGQGDPQPAPEPSAGDIPTTAHITIVPPICDPRFMNIPRLEYLDLKMFANWYIETVERQKQTYVHPGALIQLMDLYTHMHRDAAKHIVDTIRAINHYPITKNLSITDYEQYFISQLRICFFHEISDLDKFFGHFLKLHPACITSVNAPKLPQIQHHFDKFCELFRLYAGCLDNSTLDEWMNRQPHFRKHILTKLITIGGDTKGFNLVETVSALLQKFFGDTTLLILTTFIPELYAKLKAMHEHTEIARFSSLIEDYTYGAAINEVQDGMLYDDPGDTRITPCDVNGHVMMLNENDEFTSPFGDFIAYAHFDEDDYLFDMVDANNCSVGDGYGLYAIQEEVYDPITPLPSHQIAELLQSVKLDGIGDDELVQAISADIMTNVGTYSSDGSPSDAYIFYMNAKTDKKCYGCGMSGHLLKECFKRSQIVTRGKGSRPYPSHRNHKSSFGRPRNQNFRQNFKRPPHLRRNNRDNVPKGGKAPYGGRASNYGERNYGGKQHYQQTAPFQQQQKPHYQPYQQRPHNRSKAPYDTAPYASRYGNNAARPPHASGSVNALFDMYE